MLMFALAFVVLFLFVLFRGVAARGVTTVVSVAFVVLLLLTGLLVGLGGLPAEKESLFAVLGFVGVVRGGGMLLLASGPWVSSVFPSLKLIKS